MTRVAFGVLLCGLLACGGDNVLHTCDIREPGCQFDVFLAVQDVRGSVWDPWLEPPPMRVISEAEYRAEVIAAHEQALRDSGVDYITPALKLLHMIDPDESPDAATEFKVGKVSAYYEAATKHVTIVDHGDEQAQAVAVQTLAHELVHAAQDRDLGFGRLYQHVISADSSNAMSLLLEGEATMYGVLVDAKQIGWPKGRVNWRLLADWSGDIRESAFADPSPYRLVTSQFAYPLGGMYMSQVYASGGPLAVRRSYDHPPLSAARFMAGFGALADQPMPAWRCSAPASPPGFRLQLGDELGALGVYALATRITATELDAWERAQHWTGDRFYVYVNPSDAQALIVVWLLRLADAPSAAAFQSSFARMPWVVQTGAIQTLLDGDTLHIVASSSALAALAPGFEAWTQCLPL